jgi:hypothetical protein
MNPTLLALLYATGLAMGNNQIYVMRPNADPVVVRNVAQDAGFSARAAAADFQTTPEGRAWIADAGITISTQYVRLQFPIGFKAGGNPDGGNAVILPDLPWQRLQMAATLDTVGTTTCAASPNVCPLWGNTRPFKVTPFVCAWRPTDGAACTQADGGDPTTRNTMQPGGFTGAGCELKTCSIIAGDVE